jgi:hypothetical protein
MDPAIAPLIQRLNVAGIHTHQSCSGHAGAEGHPNAHVWMSGEAVTDQACARLAALPFVDQVARLWGREKFPVVEVLFPGETVPGFGRRCRRIAALAKLEES